MDPHQGQQSVTELSRIDAHYLHGQWMVPAHNQPAVVVFPPDRWIIEAVLADRPPENRNWLPGETIQDLVYENLDHGVWDRHR